MTDHLAPPLSTLLLPCALLVGCAAAAAAHAQTMTDPT